MNNPPAYAPHAIATHEGWIDPTTGEIFIAIGELSKRHGGATIVGSRVVNYKPTFSVGETIIFEVSYNEAVGYTPTTPGDKPFLQIFIDGDEVQVPLTSGAGTGQWRFHYTIPLGVGGPITMTDPTVVFLDGALNDSTPGQEDQVVDLEFSPPSLLPSIGITYPQLSSPAFSGISSQTQNGVNFTTPGQWVDFVVGFSWPILDVTDGSPTLTCQSNGTSFVASLSGSNSTTLTFTFFAPNDTLLNDDQDVQYLTLDLGTADLVMATGTYNGQFDVSGLSVANPNVTIAIVPILVSAAEFNPMSITEPGNITITLTLSGDTISNVVAPEGVSMQFRSGGTGATCAYIGHSATTISFSGPVLNSLFNNTILNPFTLFAMDIQPGSSIVTDEGTILRSFLLDYFTVDSPPTINIPS